jgi:hypothetical protein
MVVQKVKTNIRKRKHNLTATHMATHRVLVTLPTDQ